METDNPLQEPQNGWYRKYTKTFLHNSVGFMRERLPSVNANHITVFGGLLVGTGAVLATEFNSHNYTDFKRLSLPLSVITAGSLMDAIDGAWARHMQQEDPLSHNSSIGQIVDVYTDRMSELALGISRIKQAHSRHDQTAELLALASTMSNITPSLTRALVESQGKVVPEAGKGFLGFAGTRVGRGVGNVAATVMPEVKGFPVQKTLDLLTTVSNITTTADRIYHLFDGEQDTHLSEQKKQDATLRAKSLALMSGVVFGSSMLTYYLLNK